MLAKELEGTLVLWGSLVPKASDLADYVRAQFKLYEEGAGHELSKEELVDFAVALAHQVERAVSRNYVAKSAIDNMYAMVADSKTAEEQEIRKQERARLIESLRSLSEHERVLEDPERGGILWAIEVIRRSE